MLPARFVRESCGKNAQGSSEDQPPIRAQPFVLESISPAMLLNPSDRIRALGPQSGRRMDLGTVGSSGPPPRLSKRSGPARSWEEGFRMREITPAEWDGRRGLFTRLYFTEDRRLDEVRRIMATDYGFYAKCVTPVPCLIFDRWANSNGFCAQRYAM